MLAGDTDKSKQEEGDGKMPAGRVHVLHGDSILPNACKLKRGEWCRRIGKKSQQLMLPLSYNHLTQRGVVSQSQNFPFIFFLTPIPVFFSFFSAPTRVDHFHFIRSRWPSSISLNYPLRQDGMRLLHTWPNLAPTRSDHFRAL